MKGFKFGLVFTLILGMLALIVSPVLAQMPQEITSIVLGDLTPWAFIGYLIMAIIGAVIHLWLDTLDRDKSSPKTPYRWSWRFFTLDNIKRFLATILLIFICLRFFSEIIGVELSPFTAFLWGFGLDRVAGFAKNHTSKLQVNRDKLFLS
jgi:uncharacterized membrane protein YeaQ/YmgE (transglycosylase-associated protein family)